MLGMVRRRVLRAWGAGRALPTMSLLQLCTDISTTIWVATATALELPVSTTHATVGGIIGFTLVAKGGSGVIWYQSKSEFPFFQGAWSSLARQHPAWVCTRGKATAPRGWMELCQTATASLSG